MRSQANTARLLADNPVVMRLREPEVLEKIAATGKLNVLLGEKGLADKVVNLLSQRSCSIGPERRMFDAAGSNIRASASFRSRPRLWARHT
jgi:hypothetical protein